MGFIKEKKLSPIFQRTIFIIPLMVSVCVLSFAEESDALTQDEKAERRLQFNQFVESELAREKAANEDGNGQTKPWKLALTTATGYESNVNLARQRTRTSDDHFWQNTLEGEWKRGDFKWVASVDSLNYPNKDSSDNIQFALKPKYTKKLSSKLSLEFNYQLGYSDYDNNSNLISLSNKVKPVLTYQLTPQWTPSLYTSYQLKTFDKRSALSADNISRDTERRDGTFELGSGVRYSPDQKKVFGFSGGYKRNDSNDQFHDLNDYEGYKFTGFAYTPISKSLSNVSYMGLDHKFYDARTFNDSDTTEVDNLIYIGNTLTIAWAKQWNILLSYLYKQNYSSDSTKEYIDTTLTAALKLSF